MNNKEKKVMPINRCSIAIRIKERQLEDGETLRQNDSVAFKQQIKMLLHEHQVVLVETQVSFVNYNDIHFNYVNVVY